MQEFYDFVRKNNFQLAERTLQNSEDGTLKNLLSDYFNLIYYGHSLQYTELPNNTSDYRINTLFLLNKGLELYYKYGDEIEAFKVLKESLHIANQQNDKVLICETSKAILEIYERFSNALHDQSYRYFLDIHRENAYDQLELKYNKYYNFSINLRYNYEKRDTIIDLYKDLEGYLKDEDPYFLRLKNYLTLAGYHFRISQDYEQGISILKDARNIIREKSNYLVNEKRQSIDILQAVLLYFLKKPNEAIDVLKNIKNYDNPDFVFKIQQRYKYYWLYHISKEFGTSPIDSLKYKNRFLELEVLINHDKSLRSVSELETKYQAAEKEKQILVEQQKNRQNRNLFIGALAVIALGGFITSLMIKNSRRKQQLAEQEKELETQKNLTLLKEQEITTINAMVEGQEKERKRVAEDLHDNLGSVLATLKLHFENLRINKTEQKIDQEALFDKTENLIDEAYLKVRSIAHAKNAGVIANEGLLKAVQAMADKISSANKISIEVVHFGLDTPLENSLEISAFRIIQELITNILKHSKASNATINLSRHDDMLNIIVEDNGVGFNVSDLDVKTGMGLHSIKTRVEHIQGELIIDTTMHKGTTIIMNIPIE